MAETEVAVQAGAAVLGSGEAILYGVVQGLAEFLPISSSGHLKALHLLGVGELPRELEQPFDVLLHASSLVAIIVAFRKEWLVLARAHPRVWAMLVWSMVPAGLLGLFGGDMIDQISDAWWVLGIAYVFTTGLLLAANLIAQRREGTMTARRDSTDLGRLTWKAATTVGLLQACALFPGVSRSGSTLAGGLFGGLAPALALSFAFLSGGPLIAAAAAKDTLDGGFGALIDAVGWMPLTLGMIASLISGLGAIWLLRLVVANRKLNWFAAYCALAAIACFVLEGVL